MPFLEKIAGGLMNARVQHAMAAREAALYGGDSYRPAQVPSDGASRMCGAAGCTGGWMKPWKTRRRPVFEEEWGCSGRCLETMVRAAVRREVGDSAGLQDTTPHRHRVPLGLVLLAQGWITHPQLQTALAAQRASGQGRIGDWLAQSCGLEEDRITRGLGVQWGCPVLASEGFSPAAMALVMPKRFIAEFGLLPLRVAGSSLLYLAFENQMNAAAALAVEQMTGLKVESGLLAGTQFVEARTAILTAEAVAVNLTLVNDADVLTTSIASALETHQPVAAKLVRVHQYYWLRLWLESGARSGIGTLPHSTEDVQDHLFLVGGKNPQGQPARMESNT